MSINININKKRKTEQEEKKNRRSNVSFRRTKTRGTNLVTSVSRGSGDENKLKESRQT